jgi:prepilin-type N-terminal cleavage/methylation domain-containing protein
MRGGLRGFSLVEVILAAAILVIVLSALYSVMSAGWDTYVSGEAKADMQQNARLAMETVEADLRLIGYGYPTDPALVNPLRKITAASATSITFWADLNNASTVLAADAAAGDATISVGTAAGFSSGDTLWLINGGLFESRTVSSKNTGSTPHTITLSTTAGRAYPRGTLVGRPKSISYAYDGAAETITRDEGEGAGPQTLVDNVTAFALQYFDGTNAPIANPAANLEGIRRISVNFSVRSQKAMPPSGFQTYRLVSDVRPRNL